MEDRWEHLEDIFYIIYASRRQSDLMLPVVMKRVMLRQREKHIDAGYIRRAVETSRSLSL